MIMDLDPEIAEIEARYKQLNIDVTQKCLDVEKTCDHKVWCGQDWRPSDYGSAFDGIYICLKCRMEVHVPYANYTGHEKPPAGCLVLTLNQCNIENIYSLRIRGDDRSHLRKEYSSLDGWPVRQEVKEKEMQNA